MQDFQTAISTLIGDQWFVTEQRRVGGGCISDAHRVTVKDSQGQQVCWFMKSNDTTFLDNFQAECNGLKKLSEAQAIRVPCPAAVGEAAGRAWLVAEWVEPGVRGSDFFQRFGRSLAELHRCTSGTRIGLDRDNYLGAARQVNGSTPNWVEFVATHRLSFQVQWASDQRLADQDLIRDCERVMVRLDSVLEGRSARTSLLHGDLWSGNYLCDAAGNPIILDPAVYHGCREAEFGMLRLFGSCPPQFYEAYQEEFPLPAGWQRRVNVYVLYHLLNHLNLFGRGYHDQCRTLAAQILRD
ncbi:MAG: fructosamine kinase family protein [Rubripirellula sp.]